MPICSASVERREESIAQMLEVISAIGLHGNGNDIKLIFVGRGEALHKSIGSSHHAADFLIVNGIYGILYVGSTCFDLYENHADAFDGNDIYLLMADVGILIEHGVPAADKVLPGNILAPGSELVMTGHSGLGDESDGLAAGGCHAYFQHVMRIYFACRNL